MDRKASAGSHREPEAVLFFAGVTGLLGFENYRDELRYFTWDGCGDNAGVGNDWALGNIKRNISSLRHHENVESHRRDFYDQTGSNHSKNPENFSLPQGFTNYLSISAAIRTSQLEIICKITITSQNTIEYIEK